MARKFIDSLSLNKIERKSAVIVEFIGGEPLIEVDLVDHISGYFFTGQCIARRMKKPLRRARLKSS